MGRAKAVEASARLAALVIGAVGLSGCTFFASDGGGPLRRAELGTWAGLAPRPEPDAEEIEAQVARLKATSGNSFAGRYSLPGDASVFSLNCGMIYEVPFSPATGLFIKGRLNPWLRFVPGGQHGDWLFYDPADPSRRAFYASEYEWDILLGGYDRADAYDVATRERVAAKSTSEIIGFGLGWTRVRRVMPVDRVGDPDLTGLAQPSAAIADARYDLRDGHILFLGVLGWGRVNRTRYIQVLWVPIPVGEAAP